MYCLAFAYRTFAGLAGPLSFPEHEAAFFAFCRGDGEVMLLFVERFPDMFKVSADFFFGNPDFS